MIPCVRLVCQVSFSPSTSAPILTLDLPLCCALECFFPCSSFSLSLFQPYSEFTCYLKLANLSVGSGSGHSLLFTGSLTLRPAWYHVPGSWSVGSSVMPLPRLQSWALHAIFPTLRVGFLLLSFPSPDASGFHQCPQGDSVFVLFCFSSCLQCLREKLCSIWMAGGGDIQEKALIHNRRIWQGSVAALAVADLHHN